LCTWRENFQEILDKGNHDSSDMQGLGYYIVDNNIILENNHDYDSWEYFDGELEGMERILKALSSLLRGEIEVSLFLNAYDKMREEYNDFLNTYTDKGLKLCGFSEKEILEIRENIN